MVEAEQEKEQEKLVLPSVSRLKMLLILHLLPLHFMDSKYPADVFQDLLVQIPPPFISHKSTATCSIRSSATFPGWRWSAYLLATAKLGLCHSCFPQASQTFFGPH